MEERKKLQIVENRVGRQILETPVYTPVVSLYGGIEASTERLSWNLGSICLGQTIGYIVQYFGE